MRLLPLLLLFAATAAYAQPNQAVGVPVRCDSGCTPGGSSVEFVYSVIRTESSLSGRPAVTRSIEKRENGTPIASLAKTSTQSAFIGWEKGRGTLTMNREGALKFIRAHLSGYPELTLLIENW